MGLFTNLMKKAGLVEDEDALTPAQKKKKMEEARARTQERADKLKGAPLNRFQREADKLELNKNK